MFPREHRNNSLYTQQLSVKQKKYCKNETQIFEQKRISKFRLTKCPF